MLISRYSFYIYGSSCHILVKNVLELNATFTAFDISFVVDGNKIQPNGKVIVKLPIPEAYDQANLKLYHIDAFGHKTEFEFEIIDNFIVFETDHFSLYVIQEVKKKSVDQTPNETPTENSSSTSQITQTSGVNTGDHTSTGMMLFTMAVSIGMMMIVRKKKRIE